MDSRMHFTFSDTDRGVRSSRTRRTRTPSRCGRSTAAIRRRRSRRRPSRRSSATSARPYIDATAQMRDMLDRGRIALRLRRSSTPRAATSTFEAKHIVFVGRTRARLRLRAPGLVGAAGRASSADFYLRRRSGRDGDIDYRRLPHAASRSRATSSPGTRQETDTISRLVYGFATAYLLTGEDRFLEAAEKGTEYLRDHMRTVDADEGIVYWYHGIDVAGEQGEEDPRLGVRRRLRRDPGVRADLRARRPDADLPRHRRPADPERHRDDASTLFDRSSSTATAAASSRTSTRSRSTRAARRSGTTGRARTGTRSATTRPRT